jgi:beta-N-acetylhexosaminidase
MADSFNPGHSFILGFDGAEPDPDFLGLLREFTPTGIVILEHNYEKPTQLKRLISTFKSILGERAIFAVDQEPGRVQRLKEGFPESKWPLEYVEGKSTGDFADWCAETSEILSDIGINLNLAPVVDLLAQGVKFDVLNGRSFGDEFNIVNEFAGILIRTHMAAGILTCAKHFPGLGSARHDPHFKLAVSEEPYDRFENHHWRAFQDAINWGVDSVMTTHLLAKSLDEREPATYSSKVVSYLRENLGFCGPVISDDLCMKGAGESGNIGSAVLRSIQAGHNLIIISRDISIQRMAMEAVSEHFHADAGIHWLSAAHERIITDFKEKIGV